MRAGIHFRNCLLAGFVVAGSTLAAAAATTASAGASVAPNTVTYSATVTIPTPPASNFAASGGGDGWGLAFTSEDVYNVYHHQEFLGVACHNQITSDACYSPVTITDPNVPANDDNSFYTEAQPGVTVDPATQHLYVFAELPYNNSAGVVCIDTTQSPAAFCGYTQLTAAGDSPPSDGISSVSDPVLVGEDWYAFNSVDGTATGTEDQLLCFNIPADAPCASQPYSVAYGGGDVTSISFPGPSIAYIGGQILIPMNLSGGETIACFNPTNNTACGGNWPISTTSIDYPAGENGEDGGAPFPLLNAAGTTIGFCIPNTNDPCFNLAGTSVTTPTGMAAAIEPNESWDGTAVVIGARVYVPDSSGLGDVVACYDYSVDAQCANFPHPLPNLSLLYTVTQDPQRPTCLWVNSDGIESGQIQNFDAYTGGACGTGAIRVLASSIVVPQSQCIPANYTGLQVLAPAPGTYTDGTVQFEDFDGNPIPSIPTQTLDPTGSVNLTPLNLSTMSALPQFLITLPGATASEVQVKLTWVGTYSAACTSSNVLASAPPVLPPSPSQGYRLGAGDGGVYAFGTRAFFGSAASGHLNAPIVAMTPTPDELGYWLAAGDGGVFAFGDANFYGSLGAKKLNAPIVGIASTADGKGYWLAAKDGGVFALGDAPFYGSLGSLKIAAPIVAIASTADGKGYWLVGSDGGVYAFGDAGFYGSVPGVHLNDAVAQVLPPIVGIAPTLDGKGYWLVGSDGGVFSFGDAVFYGSLAATKLRAPIVGIARTPDGKGYWLAGADGGVFAFPDATFLGALSLSPLNAPLVAITS